MTVTNVTNLTDSKHQGIDIRKNKRMTFVLLRLLGAPRFSQFLRIVLFLSKMPGQLNKKYTKLNFSSEDEQKLIDLVRDEQCLYNVRHPQYKKFSYRQRKWDSIGEKLSKSGE